MKPLQDLDNMIQIDIINLMNKKFKKRLINLLLKQVNQNIMLRKVWIIKFTIVFRNQQLLILIHLNMNILKIQHQDQDIILLNLLLNQLKQSFVIKLQDLHLKERQYLVQDFIIHKQSLQINIQNLLRNKDSNIKQINIQDLHLILQKFL